MAKKEERFEVTFRDGSQLKDEGVRQTGSCRCEGYAHFALLLFRTPSFILFTLRFHTKY